MKTARKFLRDLFKSLMRGAFGPGQKEIHILITRIEKHNQTNARKLEKQMGPQLV